MLHSLSRSPTGAQVAGEVGISPHHLFMRHAQACHPLQAAECSLRHVLPLARVPDGWCCVSVASAVVLLLVDCCLSHVMYSGRGPLPALVT